MNLRTVFPILAIVPLVASVAGAADVPVGHPLCPLVLDRIETRTEERRLEVVLADSRLEAAREIFALVDALWETESIDRTTWLIARHDRDVAAVEIERQRLLVRLDEAELEQYRLFCAPATGANDASERDRAFAEARTRHREIECRRIAADLAIAEIDLAFHEELRTRVRDLRDNDVATRQDVIRAERDVAMARDRVAAHAVRVETCADRRAGDVETPAGDESDGASK